MNCSAYGRVDLAVVHDGGSSVRGVDGDDSIEPVGALGIPRRIVDGIDGELHVGRRHRRAVVPRRLGPQGPRDVHAAVVPERETSPLSRVGTRAASSGTMFIVSSVVVRPSTMQPWMSSRMWVANRLSVSGSRS